MFRFRDFRTELGLTQKEIMAILNVSQTTISFVENGTRNLTKEQMAILVDRYGEDTVNRYMSDRPNIKDNITDTHEVPPEERGMPHSLIDIIWRQQSQMDSLIQANILMQNRIDRLLEILEKQFQSKYGNITT